MKKKINENCELFKRMKASLSFKYNLTSLNFRRKSFNCTMLEFAAIINWLPKALLLLPSSARKAIPIKLVIAARCYLIVQVFTPSTPKSHCHCLLWSASRCWRKEFMSCQIRLTQTAAYFAISHAGSSGPSAQSWIHIIGKPTPSARSGHSNRIIKSIITFIFWLFSHVEYFIYCGHYSSLYGPLLPQLAGLPNRKYIAFLINSTTASQSPIVKIV